MRTLSLLLLFSVSVALGQVALPVANVNPLHGKRWQHPTHNGHTVDWRDPFLLTGASVTNLQVYHSGINDPLVLHSPIDTGFNMMWMNGATNYAALFIAPPLGVGLGSHDLANNILLDTVTGAFSWTGTASGNADFGGSTLEIPNAAGTATLSAAGRVSYNTTDKALGIHNGTKEVALSTIYHQTWSFDPKAVCDGAVDRLFLMSTDIAEAKGIHIIKWKLSFEADPTTEVDLDLKRADAFIGVANSAVMDVLDTTAGVSSEGTSANINGDAVVANGKVIYLEFGTAYTETTHQIIFEMFWEVEED